jgi:hypothetical protein
MGNRGSICDQVRGRKHGAASGQTMSETFGQMSAIEIAAYVACSLLGIFVATLLAEFFFGTK